MTSATNARRAGLAGFVALLALVGCTTGDSPDEGGPSTSTVDDSPSAEPTSEEATTEPGDEDELEEGLGEDGTYVDRDGFTIVFPADWTVRTDFAGLEVFGTPPEQLAPDFADNVGVLYEDSGIDSFTVEDYLEASVETAPSLIADFELIEQDPDNGILEYTGTAQGFELHFLALVRVEDGKAFTATFTATLDTYDAGVDDARTILESLAAT